MLFFSLALLFFILLVLATALVSLYLRVPYAPSSRKAIRSLIEVTRLKKTDTVYDLGSGDGRLAFALSDHYGCKVTGYELAPLIILWARFLRLIKGKNRTKFLFKNFLDADLSQADYLYCYLLPGMLDKLSIKLEKDKVHTTIISHSFAIRRWQPKQVIPKDIIRGTPTIYVYQI